MPIYEPGLEELVEKEERCCGAAECSSPSSTQEGVEKSDIIFISRAQHHRWPMGRWI